jgi:hypothetical protein
LKENRYKSNICNIFNKIITENFPNLEKDLPIQVQEASRTPNRLDQNRTSPWHIIIKTTSTENRGKNIVVCKREKQITYKGKPIKIAADSSIATLKARRAWSEVFQALNENNVALGYFIHIFTIRSSNPTPRDIPKGM